MINMDAKTIRKLVEYDPLTGIFIWLPREQKDFPNKRGLNNFNSRFAGKQAGYLQKRGYLATTIFTKVYKLHRLAWLYVYGEWPEHGIDHIDHDKQNNRIENLRDVPQSDNNKNCTIQKNNTSGFTGVDYKKDLKKWRARIKVDKKLIQIGTFNSFDEAVSARKSAEKLHGFHENHGASGVSS